MADVITRFKLETSQYDSKLRDATKGLAQLAKDTQKAGGDMNKMSKEQVEAARSLGKLAGGATNAKEKVRELVNAYNKLAKEYNDLSEKNKQSDFAKAMGDSLDELKKRIREAKQELYGLNEEAGKGGKGSGLLSGLGDKMGGALQVFAGNMLTKAAGAVANLGSEMYGMVQQGIELAKQGEGIRVAFERLGRGDILDGLRQATHGTVTDIELMKAAVKFNDFKLPLDELGTMLAFAQQKAKDTGQSVDYMVDSIVTGLGRKSLMILDNLGLSANEVKEKMKQTGDMTTAVGAIIREQMAKAGDYVETAADRATQANVSLQNKMEELGRKFVPVEEASTQLWTSMKIAILDVVAGPLARLLNGLTEAGRLKNQLDKMNGKGSDGRTHTERVLDMLRDYSGDKQGLANRQVARYNELETNAWKQANRLREEYKGLKKLQDQGQYQGAAAKKVTDKLRELEQAENTAKSYQIMRANYIAGAKDILNPGGGNNTVISSVGGGGRGGGGHTGGDANLVEGSIDWQAKKVQDLQKAWRAAADDNARSEIKAQLDEANDVLRKMQDTAPAEGSIDWQAKKVQELQKAWRAAADDKSREEINKQIKEANEKLDEMQGKIKAPIGSLKDLKDKMAELQASRELLTNTTDIEDIDAKLKGIEAQINKLNGKPLQLVTKESKTELEILEAKLAEVNAFIEKYGANSEEGKAARGEQKDLQNQIAGKKGEKTQLGEIQKLTGAVGGILSGIESLGIEIPKGMKDMLSGINGIISIITGITTILEFIEAAEAFSSLPFFKKGGIVPHAAGGYRVPGNDYADMTPIMVSSGELILNKAQQGNLLSQMQQARDSDHGEIVARLSGEDILLVANRHLRRTGKGELVTWKS